MQPEVIVESVTIWIPVANEAYLDVLRSRGYSVVAEGEPADIEEQEGKHICAQVQGKATDGKNVVDLYYEWLVVS